MFIEGLYIIGAIASIGGAWWAWHQANLACEFAEKAKEIRDEFIRRRKLREASNVFEATKNILKTVSKIGPTSTEESIRGINTGQIAKEVEDYTIIINEQSSHYYQQFENRARKLTDDLRNDIVALSNAKDFDEIKEAGMSIYYKIFDFQPLTKTVIDENLER